jgi:hypothetical protein
MLDRLYVGLGAAAAVPVKTRTDWYCDDGHFHKEASSQTWIGSVDGWPRCRFVETTRNGTYVELYDATQHLGIRLFATAMLRKKYDDLLFTFFRSGHWDDRRVWAFHDDDSRTGFFQLRADEVWRFVEPERRPRYVRELCRDERWIFLFDGDSEVTYALSADALYSRQRNDAWVKVRAGGWS